MTQLILALAAALAVFTAAGTPASAPSHNHGGGVLSPMDSIPPTGL